jgi:hypothetical protein
MPGLHTSLIRGLPFAPSAAILARHSARLGAQHFSFFSREKLKKVNRSFLLAFDILITPLKPAVRSGRNGKISMGREAEKYQLQVRRSWRT